jgi:hypothetical protein
MNERIGNRPGKCTQIEGIIVIVSGISLHFEESNINGYLRESAVPKNDKELI